MLQEDSRSGFQGNELAVEVKGGVNQEGLQNQLWILVAKGLGIPLISPFRLISTFWWYPEGRGDSFPYRASEFDCLLLLEGEVVFHALVGLEPTGIGVQFYSGDYPSNPLALRVL